MPKRRRPSSMPSSESTETDSRGLAVLDGRLLNGLDFCRAVYDLFDHIQQGPDGVERLRLRKTLTDKKLTEELIPIARYVQARYQEGRRIRVRWASGNQPYDAVLLSSGNMVTHAGVPRRVLLEVTGSMHPNDYLARQLFHKQGMSWGVRGVSRDLNTGLVTDKPHVHKNNDIENNLASQIVERMKSKAAKNYPWGTVLVMQCFPDTLTLESEWETAVLQVKEALPEIPFREVFLTASYGGFSETLWGGRKRPRKTRR
jgi:hypothetical protein